MSNKFEGVKDERDIIFRLAGGVGCVTNQEESDSYAKALAKGNYPTGLDGCFTVGISGGCGFDCFVLQSGDCKLIDEFLETATKEQRKYLYDNGFYDRLKGRVK